jgi:hypothetical protein
MVGLDRRYCLATVPAGVTLIGASRCSELCLGGVHANVPERARRVQPPGP